MIIKEIYISAFGGLSEKRIKLSSTLNGFVAKNGYGKTTLSVFIKAMLYGLEDGKRSITENERKRYLPWGGGDASGYMIIELAGEEYRIERSFGKRASEDTFSVYDLKTGILTDKLSERPGEDIFGIDKDGFERTVFLSEKLLSGKIENDTVRGKLGGLVGVKYDIGEYENAISLLDESRKLYIKRGGGGEIAELKNEIFDLEGRLENLAKKKLLFEDNLKSIEEIKSRLSRIAEERAELDKIKEKKDLQERFREKRRHIELLLRELSEKEARLEEIRAKLGDTPPSVDEVLTKRGELYDAKRKYEELPDGERREASPFKRVPKEEEITERLSMLTEGRQPKGGKSLGVLLPIGILLALAATALSIIISPYFCIGTAAGLTLMLLGIYQTAKGRKLKLAESVKAEAVGFIEEIYKNPPTEGDAEAQLKAALLDLSALVAEEEAIAEKSRLSLKYESALNEAQAYFDAYSSSPEELTALANEYSLLSADIKARRATLGEYSAVEGGENRIDEELAARNLDLELRDSYESALALDKEASRLALENERLSAELSEAELIKENLAEGKERLAFCEERVRILDLTRSLMVKAKNNMTSRYLDGTVSAYKRYLSMLGEEGEFTLDTSFDIKKYDGGSTREREAYSKGSRELYSFALRLALIDSLYKNELPPIIIDDAFASLDDRHLSLARELLSELSRDRQIIYFTCSSSRGLKNGKEASF